MGATTRKLQVRVRGINGIMVTAEIIGRSQRGDSQKCMIRNALAEALPEAKRVMVDLQRVRFTLDGYRYVYPLPPHVAYQLASFESGEAVEPFSFSLRDGKVYIATESSERPGSPAAIRTWAVAQGLITEEHASRKQRLPDSVKKAYAQAHPKVRIAPQIQGQRGTMSRAARRNVQTDRFYGLKLRTGFKPGGEPG